MRGRFLFAGAAATVLALPGVAVAQSSPSPSASSSTTTWPQPGANADRAQPVRIAGDKGSIRLNRQPLVLIEENVEKTKGSSFTLSADVLFDFGEAKLTEQAQKTISTVASKLEKAQVTGKVKVVGHTDDVGSKKENKKLSVERAESVKQALGPQLGSAGINLVARGRGETDPLVPNDSKAHRARNRRVALVYKSTKQDSSSRDTRSKVSLAPDDISVPDTYTAPESPVDSEEALASSQRKLKIEQSLVDTVKPTIRLDIVELDRRGPFVLLRCEAHILKLGEYSSFNSNSSLFTGGADQLQVGLYDKKAGQLLSVATTGRGERLYGTWNVDRREGDVATSWFLMTAPKGKRKSLDVYIPAFGVFENVPLS